MSLKSFISMVGPLLSGLADLMSRLKVCMSVLQENVSNGLITDAG
jgi:hypothetical protein